MRCNEVENLMMEYFDGALMKGKLDILLEHLNECEACKLEFDSLKAVLEAVETLPEVEPEVSFTETVMKKVEKRRWSLRSERFVSGFLWAAALFAFMILTRDFFQDGLNSVANSPMVASLFTGASASMVGSDGIFAGLTGFFSDIPGKLTILFERTLYLRTILLSEYLTVVLGLVITFFLANLGLGKIFLGKNPNRRAA